MRAIQSLISKSEKTLTKLAVKTWQHTMMLDNLAALRSALTLIQAEGPVTTEAEPKEYQKQIDSMESMISTTERMLKKFKPASSQRTLLQNRLNALRMAVDAIQRRASERKT